MSIEEAFWKVCEEAKKPKGNWVSLYVSTPFFGGYEEGGWWGSDCDLVASEWCSTEEEAKVKLAAVRKLAEESSNEARQAFYKQCRNELDAADSRGIDYDQLREPDGEERYWVTAESERGSCISRGCRHYE